MQRSQHLIGLLPQWALGSHTGLSPTRDVKGVSRMEGNQAAISSRTLLALIVLLLVNPQVDRVLCLAPPFGPWPTVAAVAHAPMQNV